MAFIAHGRHAPHGRSTIPYGVDLDACNRELHQRIAARESREAARLAEEERKRILKPLKEATS